MNGERIDEIADAILRVLGDDAFRARLEAGAPWPMHRPISWEHSVQIFQNLCERLQNKGRQAWLNPRTLLVIAGEFPPSTIGRIRTVKFVEHLRRFGWRCIVVTLQPSGREGNYDEALMAEIVDGDEIIRLPLRNLEVEIADTVKRLLGRKPAPCQRLLLRHRRLAGAWQPGRRGAAGRRADGQGPRHDPLGAAHPQNVPDDFRPGRRMPPRCAALCANARSTPSTPRCRRSPVFTSATSCARKPACRGSPTTATGNGDVLREWMPEWRKKMEFRWSAGCRAGR